MEQTLEQQALDWLKERRRKIMERSRQLAEGGPLFSMKTGWLDPQGLEEPLRSAVLKLMDQLGL